MLSKEKTMTKFTVMRFKRSGKYYDGIIVAIPVRTSETGVYMYDAIDFLIANKYNEDKTLVVDHKEGYPHLINAKGN